MPASPQTVVSVATVASLAPVVSVATVGGALYPSAPSNLFDSALYDSAVYG